MISQLIQNSTETLSTSNGMAFPIILTTVLFIGPAFVAAIIVFIWPLDRSERDMGPTETETDIETRTGGIPGTESGVILRFRRKRPNLEADVPTPKARKLG